MLETQKAYRLAKRALADCQSKHGIMAGCHHFTDIWARDGLFATFGANIVSPKTSIKTIETFLRFQTKDGFIPHLIMLGPLSIQKYLGKPAQYKSPKARHRQLMSGGLVLDGGLMTVVAAGQYVKETGSLTFMKKSYKKLRNAMVWYLTHFDGLLSEWFLCEWADAILKSGNVLYTNILYWKALSDLSSTAGKLGNKKDELAFGKQATRIQDLLRKQFWNGSYFADWVDHKRQDYFASYPNMLAIIFGLATKQEASSILALAKAKSWRGFTLEENVPNYPFWRVPLFYYLMGLPGYHNAGCLWLQPGLAYVLALFHVGKKKEAGSILSAIASHIITHKGVHEIYERDGKPTRTFFYTSEEPFAWSAGLYVYAHSRLYP